jgi:hypothetical protein
MNDPDPVKKNGGFTNQHEYIRIRGVGGWVGVEVVLGLLTGRWGMVGGTEDVGDFIIVN